METPRKGENEPRFSSWFVVGTHWVGLPLPGSPGCITLLHSSPSSVSSIERACAAHIPLERGGGERVRVSERDEAFGFEPTSLKGGEGLVSVRLRVVGGELRWGRRREW